MAVKEISIMQVVDRIFERTVKLMPETTVNLANKLIDTAYAMWKVKAENAPLRKDGQPSLWGERYASTLKVDLMTGKGGTASVYVDESHENFKFVEMVEKGVESWSIKDALLKGKAAQRNLTKYGVAFVHVPFRHRTPGVSRKSRSYTSIMPKNVYELAKSGGKVGQEYGHYAGLKKISEGVHTQYMTFRTVSAQSQDWVYPAKQATPVFDEIKQKVEQMIEQTLTNFVQGFLKDMEQTRGKL